MTDQHPLTDDMCEEIQGRFGALPDHWYYDAMRATYDLGFKAGNQASEGAMDALRRTIKENREAMRILAMGDDD